MNNIQEKKVEYTSNNLFNFVKKLHEELLTNSDWTL